MTYKCRLGTIGKILENYPDYAELLKGELVRVVGYSGTSYIVASLDSPKVKWFIIPDLIELYDANELIYHLTEWGRAYESCIQRKRNC